MPHQVQKVWLMSLWIPFSLKLEALNAVAEVLLDSLHGLRRQIPTSEAGFVLRRIAACFRGLSMPRQAVRRPTFPWHEAHVWRPNS